MTGVGPSWRCERPSWCPVPGCGFVASSQAALCIGRLPAPEPHDGGENTHRLCLKGAKDDGEWLFKLCINRGDAWHIGRMFKAAFGGGAV